jgi:hypothetical protein
MVSALQRLRQVAEDQRHAQQHGRRFDVDEQRQQGQRDDWHADPDCPLQEAGDEQAANHGSNDT